MYKEILKIQGFKKKYLFFTKYIFFSFKKAPSQWMKQLISPTSEGSSSDFLCFCSLPRPCLTQGRGREQVGSRNDFGRMSIGANQEEKSCCKTKKTGITKQYFLELKR